MGDEIELISDGDGLAVIGEPKAVERFLGSVGLASTKLPRLKTMAAKGSAAANAGSTFAEGSGRWVKLTTQSAKDIKELGGLMPTKSSGVSHAMIGNPGDIKKWLQIENGVGALASNPALLAGAAGILSQMAMEQTMAEITDYLARIDEKLDDVLRAQTNQVLARMDGVDLALMEATSVRDAVGRVSEVTWSKVQNSSSTIHDTQGYALRQLSDLADKLERQTKVDDLVKTARDAEVDVQKWLAVLARCFHLHDSIAVLELERVLDASPDELDRHRIGLKAARQDRLELISRSTERLLQRMGAAVETANSKVLFNPIQSPAIVTASNVVNVDIDTFHKVVGIEVGGESSEATRWRDAAAERLDKAREVSAGGLDAARGFGADSRDQAKAAKDKLTGKFAGRLRRRSSDGEDEGPAED